MCCNGMTRLRSTPTSSSVMCRKLRRLRVTVIFYTCGSLCAILLLVNFNDDVKKLLQQSQYSGSAPHELQPLESAAALISPRDVLPSGKFNESPTRKEPSFLSVGTVDRSYQAPYENTRPWFMQHGTRFPQPQFYYAPSKLWPEEEPSSDRIVEQLMYVLDEAQARLNSSNFSALPGPGPNNNIDDKSVSTVQVTGTRWNSNNINSKGFLDNDLIPRDGNSNSLVNSPIFNATKSERSRIKTILLYYGLGMSWGTHITSGRHVFLEQKCPVNACRLTGNRAHLNKADAVVFKDVFMNPKVRRQARQLWVMYMLECPLNTQNFVDKNMFNMTATYRHDSDIVTPYEKWVYFDDSVRSLPQAIDFAKGKTKKVAWFVSNCVAKNNRLEFARELGKHIEVDIYGACGSHSCSRANAKQCFDLLSKHYKFYLAFENSNCRDYISEKFFVNGLGNSVLPIVMGAHPDDYKRVAPEKSYIHVDDFASPKELAQYLLTLDASDDLYNEYFRWKDTGEFVNTHFFCRLCSMVHYADRSDHKNRYYEDFNKWWRGPNVCTRRSWRNQPDIFAVDYYDKQTTNQENA